LCFGEFCKHSVYIDALWLDALWLRTLWKFWWCFKERTAWALASAFATFPTLVTVTTFATWTTFASFATRATTLVTVTSSLFAQLLSDWLERLLRGEQLQHAGTFGFLLRSRNRKNASAIEVGFNFGAHNVFYL
jgi:hypothetical protein